jgi:membrane-bound lytic murein transglycosylase A
VLRRLDFGLLAGLVALSACQQPIDEPAQEPVVEEEAALVLPTDLELIPSDWDALADWGATDLSAARAAFLRSCARLDGRPDDEWLNPRASWAGQVGEWRSSCAAALLAPADDAALRNTFETVFQPVQATAINPESASVETTGMLTGYYEPYVEVRRAPEEPFTQPLRRRPDDLVSVDLGLFDAELAGRRLVGQVEDGQLVFYRDRAEIEMLDAGDAFAWGRPIDVFFLQIQGSGRLVYEDGSAERAAFAAHNGLPYHSIGRELIARGELERHAASKSGIEAWLNANGPEATAELFSVNPRYVFFATEPLTDPNLGPRGSSGVSLTPMASIAVDPAHHAQGVPVWIEADLPELPGWSGVVVTQDAGGAITGPLRADFFWGWGETAERRAGTTRARVSWTILLPVAIADRIADATPPA